MTTIALIACCGKKADHDCRAIELYQSPLFWKSVDYANKHADRILILSAKFGVVHPDDIIAPYDLTLSKMSKQERARWTSAVRSEMLHHIDDDLLLLAGSLYLDWIPGFKTTNPLQGLGIGKRLAFLSNKTNGLFD